MLVIGSSPSKTQHLCLLFKKKNNSFPKTNPTDTDGIFS